MYGVFSKNGNYLRVFRSKERAIKWQEAASATRIYLGFLRDPIPEHAECSGTFLR